MSVSAKEGQLETGNRKWEVEMENGNGQNLGKTFD